jgi:hypothetical protein
MSSAMMCEFFLPRRRFCVISRPAIDEHAVLRGHAAPARRMSSRYASKSVLPHPNAPVAERRQPAGARQQIAASSGCDR